MRFIIFVWLMRKLFGLDKLDKEEKRTHEQSDQGLSQ